MARIAKEDNRRLQDLIYLCLGRGLSFFFCETVVSIKKESDEYTEEERKQEEKNKEIIAAHPDWNEYGKWSFDQRKELGWEPVSEWMNNCNGGKNFLEVLSDSIENLARDSEESQLLEHERVQAEIKEVGLCDQLGNQI